MLSNEGSQTQLPGMMKMQVQPNSGGRIPHMVQRRTWQVVREIRELNFIFCFVGIHRHLNVNSHTKLVDNSEMATQPKQMAESFSSYRSMAIIISHCCLQLSPISGPLCRPWQPNSERIRQAEERASEGVISGNEILIQSWHFWCTGAF